MQENRIVLLFGTMTGTAELVAEDVAAFLGSEAGLETEVLPMDDLDSSVFARPGVFLIVTSTYGAGDVPDNARGFIDDIRATSPDLSAARYGVIGLGDSTYDDTFNFGGKQFDEALLACGATRVGTRLAHDASGGAFPEEEAVAWARDWVGELSGGLAEAAE